MENTRLPRWRDVGIAVAGCGPKLASLSCRDYLRQPIETVSSLIRQRSLSASELTRAALEEIGRANPVLHAFNTVTHEEALAEAARADREIAHGRYRGPLHGIPIAHKDNLCTRGVPTTANSRLWKDHIPARDATVVARLRTAGAISVGKSALYELAMGLPAHGALFPQVLNPWDLDRSTGGSSSGSAAAVAAGLVLGATGSDTGGSVRHPAAVCGVVGLKPTAGLVPVGGLIPLVPGLDQVGLMTLTARGNALMLQAVTGSDKPFCPELAKCRPLEGMTVGVPEAFLAAIRIDQEVMDSFRNACQVLSGLGAQVRPVVIAGLERSAEWGSALMAGKIWPLHQHAVETRPGLYGEPMLARLIAFSKTTPQQIAAASRGKRQLRSAFRDAFTAGFDVIATPGRETAADLVGSLSTAPRGQSHQMYNLTAMPAIVVPAGFTKANLPVSVQFAAAWYREDLLYQVAVAYEDATGWWQKAPPPMKAGIN